MGTDKAIAIMIHDLNPWGGQDRSMLEIAWQLNKKFPLQIHSYSLQGYDNWPNMQHIPYRATIKKPILFKYLNYHWNSWNRLKVNRPHWVQSTGTACLTSDIVQVQFIHHTWQDIAANLPNDKSRTPGLLRRTYQQLLNNYKKKLEQQIYTPEKKYIAISHSIKKELMTHFSIPEENIQIIYHGVDPRYFKPVNESSEAQQTRAQVRKELGVADKDFVLLHVGALNARKGLFQSLKVVSYLKKEGFDQVKLLAVGQGDQKILESWSRKYDIGDRILLAPHSKDIRTYYWASDCFFFPTFYEPFGLVILEAMACGLPVVASQMAGGAELIEQGSNGVLFNPYASIKEISNHLLPVIKDTEYAAQLSQKGCQTAQAQSWEKVGKEYMNFYQNLDRSSA